MLNVWDFSIFTSDKVFWFNQFSFNRILLYIKNEAPNQTSGTFNMKYSTGILERQESVLFNDFKMLFDLRYFHRSLEKWRATLSGAMFDG